MGLHVLFLYCTSTFIARNLMVLPVATFSDMMIPVRSGHFLSVFYVKNVVSLTILFG